MIFARGSCRGCHWCSLRLAVGRPDCSSHGSSRPCRRVSAADREKGTGVMIRATVSALHSGGVSQSVLRTQETPCRGRYDQLVQQGFLRQEELAIALSEAVRKRLDAATCLMDRY